MRNFLVTILLSAFSIYAFAQQSLLENTRVTQHLLYLPENYATDTAKRFPLVLFLHGAGEVGDNISKLKNVGLPKLIEQGKKFPFIVLSPQAPEVGWDKDELYRLLQHIKKNYRVDPDRIYVTGMSMGGTGTWELAISHPEVFAAAAPLCGGQDTLNMFRLRNTAIWAFHGLKDDVAPPQRTIDIVNTLKRYNSSVKLTLYPEANHNCWDTTYNNPAFYDWLLQQKKFVYQEVSVKQSLLNSYAGTYAHGIDTVYVLSEDGKLIFKPNKNRRIEMKAAADAIFFVDARQPVDIRFEKRRNKMICILNRQSREEYYKLK